MHARLIFLILALFLCMPRLPDTLAADQGRFFLMGSGELHLKNHRNQREARVQLLHPDGSLNQEALGRVDWVFGFPTNEKGEHISPRMLCMLSYFADLLAPGKTIQIESAYRSPEYNEQIRAMGNNAARTSTHLDGLALDFWLEGVDGKKIWETIRSYNCGGIGHYGGRTVHFDAGRPRFWEAATSGTRSPEPDRNRHLYLSTNFDRYRAGEPLRLSLSSLSSFAFGVRPEITLFATDAPTAPRRLPGMPVATVRLHGAGADQLCLPIGNRKASRFLHITLPADLPPGRYSAGLRFCDKPFSEMPDQSFSNPFEVR
ncbi:MAG: YcbK family protein [Desulfobulbus sp.]|jgi:uncharacterized protein YcbK (DUF882 family)